MSFTAAELAQRIGGEVVGEPTVVLHRFAPVDRAQPGDLTFAENELYFARADQGAATAILVEGPATSTRKVLIRVSNARIASAKVLDLFFPEPPLPPGVHPTAVVASSAQVDRSAHIGPYCVIGEHARVGARAVLEGGDHVGARCELGQDVRLFPRVTLYADTRVGDRVRIHAGAVVGSDGYGYVLDNGAHRKIKQVGCVVIEADAEIGANVTIDRGALGATVIGQGTKIDNLVHIAHNVQVGRHCLLVAQVGIAGSTRLGDYVTLAGQVGLAGHLKLGNAVTIGAKSGVMNSIPEGEKWWGNPARPIHRTKRHLVALEYLPELLKRVAALEKRLGTSPVTESPPAAPDPTPPA